MKGKYAASPYLLWMVLFILLPLGLIVYFAFTNAEGSFTLENITQSGNYFPILIRSIWLAAVSTAVCLVLGYPIAYLMSRWRGSAPERSLC